MTKKELEAQAKEYGYTVEEIKEFRKHIKPFLRFAIDSLKQNIESLKRNGTRVTSTGLCDLSEIYVRSISSDWSVMIYLKNRILSVMPVDKCEYMNYWWKTSDIEAQQKRIDFCRLQLKLVKP